MSSLAVTYYCDDAAERIADLIEEYEKKRQLAESKKNEQDEAIAEIDSDMAELESEEDDSDNDEEALDEEYNRATLSELEDNRKDLMSKRSAAMRDMHRATTSVRALKEALQFVLLEQACRTDGAQHHMPNVNRYLASRAPAA